MARSTPTDRMRFLAASASTMFCPFDWLGELSATSSTSKHEINDLRVFHLL
jgi:hypothetical protein